MSEKSTISMTPTGRPLMVTLKNTSGSVSLLRSACTSKKFLVAGYREPQHDFPACWEPAAVPSLATPYYRGRHPGQHPSALALCGQLGTQASSRRTASWLLGRMQNAARPTRVFVPTHVFVAVIPCCVNISDTLTPAGLVLATTLHPYTPTSWSTSKRALSGRENCHLGVLTSFCCQALCAIVTRLCPALSTALT